MPRTGRGFAGAPTYAGVAGTDGMGTAGSANTQRTIVKVIVRGLPPAGVAVRR
jgi:hypothetical protein